MRRISKLNALAEVLRTFIEDAPTLSYADGTHPLGKLVKQQRQVQRDGKTFEQTYWVREHAPESARATLHANMDNHPDMHDAFSHHNPGYTTDFRFDEERGPKSVTVPTSGLVTLAGASYKGWEPGSLIRHHAKHKDEADYSAIYDRILRLNAVMFKHIHDSGMYPDEHRSQLAELQLKRHLAHGDRDKYGGIPAEVAHNQALAAVMAPHADKLEGVPRNLYEVSSQLGSYIGGSHTYRTNIGLNFHIPEGNALIAGLSDKGIVAGVHVGEIKDGAFSVKHPRPSTVYTLKRPSYQPSNLKRQNPGLISDLKAQG